MSGLEKVYDLKDENQAKEYLDNLGIEYRFQCYKENLPEGCHRLADYFEAFKRDFPKARKLYESNCTDSQFGLSCFKAGQYSLLGKGGEQSEEKAFEFHSKGCDLENATSCHNAGLLLASGKVGDKKKDKLGASKFMQISCDVGNAASCQELSSYYISGKDGIQKDMVKAFTLAEKACSLNHMYACANLSVMYKRGDGVKQDLAKAEQYKKRAKELFADATEQRQTITFSQ